MTCSVRPRSPAFALAWVATLVLACAEGAADAGSEAERVRYDGGQLLRVTAPDERHREAIDELVKGGDAQRWHIMGRQMDIFVHAEKLLKVKQHLGNSQLDFNVLIENVQDAIEEENPPGPPHSEEDLQNIELNGHKMTWNHYHRVDVIYDYLDYLAQTYPGTVSVETIGYSVEKRPIKVIKISSGDPNSKAIWVDGGIHAREWISPASVTKIISELVENRDNHTEMVLRTDYYILPVVNPDGYEYTHTTERFWRKNRAPHESCVGVDLNRNWGYHWGGVGASDEVCDEIYGGPAAFSEPETKAIKDFVLAHKDEIEGYLTFHCYGQFVLIPWGFSEEVPPDYIDLERVGNTMGETMRETSGHEYIVGNTASVLYPAAGGSHDWFKGEAGVKYTFAVELPDRGRYGFMMPAKFISPVAEEALVALRVIQQAVQDMPQSEI